MTCHLRHSGVWAGHQGTLTSLSQMLTINLSGRGEKRGRTHREGQASPETIFSSHPPTLSSDIISSEWPSFSKYCSA